MDHTIIIGPYHIADYFYSERANLNEVRDGNHASTFALAIKCSDTQFSKKLLQTWVRLEDTQASTLLVNKIGHFSFELQAKVRDKSLALESNKFLVLQNCDSTKVHERIVTRGHFSVVRH